MAWRGVAWLGVAWRAWRAWRTWRALRARLVVSRLILCLHCLGFVMFRCVLVVCVGRHVSVVCSFFLARAEGATDCN